MRLGSLLLTLALGAPAYGQISYIAGLNGMGHSTLQCVDRDGDGYGVGPTVVTNTTASSPISAGTQTVGPASMTTVLTGVSTTSGSPTLTGIANLYTLQVGMSLSGTGIPNGASIASVNTGTIPVSVTMSSNATATGTVSVTVGIAVGTVLRVDTGDNMEKVVVTANTPTTFTAKFLTSHAAGALISDQGCLGPDADDLDATVWTSAHVIAKYGSVTAFWQKFANDIVIENADGIAANAAARAAGLTSPNHTYWLAPSTASPAGSDSNTCTTAASPCLTINPGLVGKGYATGGGDLIVMRNGWNGAITLFNGNSSKHTVVISYPGEQANPQGTPNQANLSDTAYIWLEGIKFSGGADISAGTTIGGAHPPSITWHDNLYRHIDATGPFADLGGVTGYDQTNNTFEDSAYHDNSYSGSQHGMYIGSRTYQSTNITLQRLLIYNNQQNGLHWNGRCSGCVVQQSAVYGNGISGLDFEQGWNHSTIKANLVFSNTKQLTFFDYESGACPGRTYDSTNSQQFVTGVSTAGSNVITNIAGGGGYAGNNVQVGDVVLASTSYGIPAGTHVTAVSANSITLNNNATANCNACAGLHIELNYFTAGGGVIICPYPESNNLIEDNTIYATGADSWPSFNTPQAGCASNVPDCSFDAIRVVDETFADPTNPAGAQTQVGGFTNYTFRNNIIAHYGAGNTVGAISVFQNDNLNPSNQCNSSCQSWLTTYIIDHDIFYQSDGLGGTNIFSTPGALFTCAQTGAAQPTGAGVTVTACSVGSPSFVDVQPGYYVNMPRMDFRILPASPAYRSGVSTNMPFFDFAGRTYVDSTPSMGALERSLYPQGWTMLPAATALRNDSAAGGAGLGNCPADNFGGSTGWQGVAGMPYQAMCNYNIDSLPGGGGWKRDAPGVTPMICLTGGGHNDSGDNSDYCTNINSTSPVMTRVFGPNLFTLSDWNVCHAGLPSASPVAPNSRHLVDNATYIGSTDQVFLNNGALACAGSGITNLFDTWVYTFSTNTWSRKDPVDCTNHGFGTGCGLVANAPTDPSTYSDLFGNDTQYDPVTKTVMYVPSNQGGGIGFGQYFPLNNQFVIRTPFTGPSAKSSNVGSNSFFDYNRRFMWAAGFTPGGSPYAVKYDLTNITAPNITDYNTTCAGDTVCNIIQNATGPGLAFRPTEAKAYAWLPNGGSTLYKLDSGTMFGSILGTFTGGPPTCTVGSGQLCGRNGVFGRFQYINTMDVFALIPYYNGATAIFNPNLSEPTGVCSLSPSTLGPWTKTQSSGFPSLVQSGCSASTYACTGLPTGLSINSSTGAITGTISASGTFTPNCTYSTASITPTIVVNTSPIILSTSPLPNGTVNVPYTTTLSETGGTPALVWSVSAGALPPGLTLNSSTGVISGTPTTAVGSPFSTTITLTDFNNISYSVVFSTTIGGGVTPKVGPAFGSPVSVGAGAVIH